MQMLPRSTASGRRRNCRRKPQPAATRSKVYLRTSARGGGVLEDNFSFQWDPVLGGFHVLVDQRVPVLPVSVKTKYRNHPKVSEPF